MISGKLIVEILKLDSHLPKRLDESTLKMMKNVLFYLKSSFRSRDI